MTITYEPVIGMECHAELLTESKMFCGCANAFGGAPNTRTCPVCLGLPGSLPVMNRQAVQLVLRTALALHCEVSRDCVFARKNYFYPDLPKGYQISQMDDPVVQGGSLTFGIAPLVDYLWPLWDEENRALHDYLVDTRTVLV